MAIKDVPLMTISPYLTVIQFYLIFYSLFNRASPPFFLHKICRPFAKGKMILRLNFWLQEHTTFSKPVPNFFFYSQDVSFFFSFCPEKHLQLLLYKTLLCLFLKLPAEIKTA